MEDDAFEWDDEKARSNLVKHGVDFREATLTFSDPGGVDELDDALDYGEERTKLIGMANGRLIAVIFTLRNGRIRIISARKASREERDDYVRQSPSN